MTVPIALYQVLGGMESRDMLRDLLRIFYDAGLYAYLASTIVLAVWFFWRRRGLWIAGISLLGLGLVMQVGYIIVRWIVGKQPPFANTFETMVLLAACLAAFFLVMVWSREWRPLSPLPALAALMVTVYASFIMPEEIKPLMPALQSHWLTVHVIICIVSYAAFILAYIGALAFLARETRHSKGAALALALTITGLVAACVVVALSRREDWEAIRTTVLLVSSGAAVMLAFGLWPVVGIVDRKLRLRERLPEKEFLNRMTYKAVALGFPFLTLGIITGSVWANQAR